MPTRPSGKGCAKGRWELKRLESDRNLKAPVCASSLLTARRARRMGRSQHTWIDGASEPAAGWEVSVSQDMDSCSFCCTLSLYRHVLSSAMSRPWLRIILKCPSLHRQPLR
jgi:hypothetical protein